MKTTLLSLLLSLSVLTYAKDAAGSEEVLPKTDDSTSAEYSAYETPRFSAITEAGSTFNTSFAHFNAYQAIGCKVNPYLFIGAGFGIETQATGSIQLQTVADLRYYMLDRRWSPMLVVKAGANRGAEFSGGDNSHPSNTQFVLNVGPGIIFRATDRVAFTLNGGYSLLTDFNRSNKGGFLRIGYIF